MSRSPIALPRGLHVLPALRRDQAGIGAHADTVVDESAVALSFNGSVYVVMMATDADLEDYALGFALNEGIIADAHEWSLIEVERRTDGIVVESRIPQQRYAALRERQRRLVGSSGCGLCGAESLAEALRPVAPVDLRFTLPAAAVSTALDELVARQALNRRCGGAHAAGFFAGGFALVREDVGRHNALDKLRGAMERAPGTRAGVLALSSRASYELVHKAATMGIAVMATVSAPTSAAIALAQRCNVTLVGFARGESFNLYTHAERIQGGL